MRNSLAFLCLVLSTPFLIAQAAANAPVVAPGLQVPATSIPYALDQYQGKTELVPMHHSTVRIDNHQGANFAGALAGSFFYKPKMTVELASQHARTQLHTTCPIFYFHAETDSDPSDNDPHSDTAVIALVQTRVQRDKRVLTTVRFTQITGHAQQHNGIVKSNIEKLPGGWFRLTPLQPMSPGEYALMPILRIPSTFSEVVFDFGIDPNAPEAKGAITANANQESKS